MTQRGLDEVNRRAVIQRMAGVCVAEPVGADPRGFVRHPCLLRGIAQDDSNSAAIKRLATPGGEHRFVISCVFPQVIECRPELWRQRNRASAAVLAEYGGWTGGRLLVQQEEIRRG